MSLPVTLVQGAYIVAGLSFILALAGLSRHETARAGNRFGIIGMTIALVATILAATAGTSVSAGRVEVSTEGSGGFGLALILAAMGIGAVIGLDRAKKVEMTGMPELIAMLHSFVGLAAVLVGWNSSVEDTPYPVIHDVEVVDRGLHRRGDVHRLDRRQPQAVGADQVHPADAARASNMDQPRRDRGVLRAHRLVYVVMPARRDSWPARPCWCSSPCVALAARLAPGRLHRRRRHAGGGVDAQQLLRLGRGRGRASCSATTCSSSPARWSAPRVPTCPTSCARR
jgi:hypothetical protein